MVESSGGRRSLARVVELFAIEKVVKELQL
jgi:hypothetical protein